MTGFAVSVFGVSVAVLTGAGRSTNFGVSAGFVSSTALVVSTAFGVSTGLDCSTAVGSSPAASVRFRLSPAWADTDAKAIAAYVRRRADPTAAPRVLFDQGRYLASTPEAATDAGP